MIDILDEIRCRFATKINRGFVPRFFFYGYGQFAGQQEKRVNHPFSLVFFRPLTNTMHFYIWDDCLVSVIISKVIIRLLLDEICFPLGKRILLNVNCSVLDVLKVHFWVWDNFVQLKALQKWKKIFFISY